MDHSRQCDRILWHFGTLAKFRYLWQIIEGLFRIWLTFGPTLTNHFWPLVKMSLLLTAKYWTNNVAVWSHRFLVALSFTVLAEKYYVNYFSFCKFTQVIKRISFCCKLDLSRIIKMKFSFQCLCKYLYICLIGKPPKGKSCTQLTYHKRQSYLSR